MKTVFSFCSFLFILNTSWGQTGSPRLPAPTLWENIHLHMNKTTFSQGERLWFTAYVQNQKKKLPSLESTNLYVALYNSSGEEVKHKMFYVENGISSGDFAIDSTLVEEDYLVLAWTNYMRNFKELQPFIQKIRVLQDLEEDVAEPLETIILQVYPEGGNLAIGSFCQIGIRAVDKKGNGIALHNITLVDKNGEVIRSNIATNDHGLGKTGFIVEEHNTYVLQAIQPNGNLVSKALPAAVPNHIGLNIDNKSPDKILVKLVSSLATFKQKARERYTLAIYKNDSIFLEDIDIDSNEQVVSIDRQRLPRGINTTVLLDTSLKPVAWRMFYNHYKDESTLKAVSVEYCRTSKGDSLQVDFILPKGANTKISLSVSTLPWETNAYHPLNSIASSFLMLPYIKSRMPNEKYYFEGQDRQKRYELDLRLLIEGWGRFDWDLRMVEAPKIAFALENGIQISGKILDADLTEEKKVYLVTDQTNTMTYINLQKDKSFETTMIVYDRDSLGVSVIGKKGKLRRPKLEMDIQEVKAKSGYNASNLFNRFILPIQKTTNETYVEERPLTMDKRTIVLQEVVVHERVTQDNKFLINAELEGSFIGDAEIKKHNSVGSYLSSLGFLIGSAVVDGISQTVVRSRVRDNPIIPVTIQGFGQANEMSLNMPLQRVQFFMFDINRKAWIVIVPRKGFYTSPENRNRFVKHLIINGYVKPQQFFNAGYTDYDSRMFKQFGAIDWQDQILVNDELPTSISMPVFGQEKLLLFIEGMGRNGTLVSKVEEIIMVTDESSN